MIVTQMQVRSASERIVEGPLVPLGQDTPIRPGLVERFAPGVFASQQKDPRRVRLTVEHSTHPGSLPIGHVVELREEDGVVLGAARIARGALGDHWLALLEDPDAQYRSWSVGYVPERVTKAGNVTVVERARLKEVAIVQHPAYADAGVVAVRHALDTPATPGWWRSRLGL